MDSQSRERVSVAHSSKFSRVVNVLAQSHGYNPPPKSFLEMLDIPFPTPVDASWGFPDFEDDHGQAGALILSREWLKKTLTVEWFPILGQRYVHRGMVVPLYRAMVRIDQLPVPQSGPFLKPKQCGIFNPRRIGWRANAPMSFHALALAVDLNWNENPYGKLGKMRDGLGPTVTRIMEEEGFFWGGHWDTPDDMHFQYAGDFVLPRDMARG